MHPAVSLIVYPEGCVRVGINECAQGWARVVTPSNPYNSLAQAVTGYKNGMRVPIEGPVSEGPAKVAGRDGYRSHYYWTRGAERLLEAYAVVPTGDPDSTVNAPGQTYGFVTVTVGPNLSPEVVDEILDSIVIHVK
jgi:hypothetical protein